MSRRRSLLMLVCALVALVSAAPALAKGHGCTVRHSHTLARNGLARVFEAPGQLAGSSGKVLYGCLKTKPHLRKLALRFDDQYVSSSSYADVRLAGTFVAWSESGYDISCKADCPPGYSPVSSDIQVYDLRTRARHFAAGATVAAGALVLSPAGSLGWLQQGTDLEVHVQDSAGMRLIDHGNIDPSSLHFANGTLTWTKDGQLQSAALA